MTIDVINRKTGAIIHTDCERPEQAINEVFYQWLCDHDFDWGLFDKLGLQMFPYYDDVRRQWFWEDWYCEADVHEHLSMMLQLAVTNVSQCHDNVIIETDRWDYDGLSGNYETTIEIPISRLYALIMNYAPECIVSKKVGCFYE